MVVGDGVLVNSEGAAVGGKPTVFVGLVDGYSFIG